MQGYLDLRDVTWDAEAKTLRGVSKIVGGDPYRVTLALNGYTPDGIHTYEENIQAVLSVPREGLAEFTLEGPENTEAAWSLSF